MKTQGKWIQVPRVNGARRLLRIRDIKRIDESPDGTARLQVGKDWLETSMTYAKVESMLVGPNLTLEPSRTRKALK